MKIKQLIYTILIGVIFLGIVSCEMSKSTPPPKSGKTTNNKDTDIATSEMIDPGKMLSTHATETALANAIVGLVETPLPVGTILTPLEESDLTTLMTSEGTTQPGSMIGTPQPSIMATSQAALVITPLVGTPQTSPDPNAQPTVMMMVNIPSPTAGPPPQSYTIQAGESLYCLARRFNVSISGLQSHNNVGNLINPGQIIQIPQDGKPFEFSPRSRQQHPTTYSVKAGDTIYSIACAFGDVDPVYLAQINNISAPYTLTPAQVLQVP